MTPESVAGFVEGSTMPQVTCQGSPLLIKTKIFPKIALEILKPNTHS